MLAQSPAAAGYRAIAAGSRVVTWWGSFIECACAVARRAREGSAPSQTAESYRMLDLLAQDWREIQPSERLRRTAIRVAKSHPSVLATRCTSPPHSSPAASNRIRSDSDRRHTTETSRRTRRLVCPVLEDTRCRVPLFPGADSESFREQANAAPLQH